MSARLKKMQKTCYSNISKALSKNFENVKAEPQMEHDEYVETEQQIKDVEFVFGK